MWWLCVAFSFAAFKVVDEATTTRSDQNKLMDSEMSLCGLERIFSKFSILIELVMDESIKLMGTK